MSVDASAPRLGGHILVEALRRQGVDTIYGVPGESFLPVLDALHAHAHIRFINTCHEGAAANMADAHGKLTARVGVAMVTRGPGASHAANGVHTAMQDSTPMVLFIGQIDTAIREREGFQEVDYRRMFGGLAKWATEIEQIERIPEIVQRAFAVALSGRPGPVVVALPENILFGSAVVADLVQPVVVPEPAPTPAALEDLRARLLAAQRPLVIVGGTGWTREACAQWRAFVEAWDLPVAAGFRRQDVLDNRSAQYVGQLGLGISPALAERVRAADLIWVVGSRLSEITSSGYTLIESPRPRQTLVHVHPSAEELNRVFQADLPIQSRMVPLVQALSQWPSPSPARPWRDWRAQARADYQAHHTPAPRAPERVGVDMAHVVAHLAQTLPDDAVLTNGAGNYTVWLHRYYTYRLLGTELAPTNGAMGYGLPAAIAAKIAEPHRTVVCFAGDGCFMMYPQELATAVRYGAAVIVLVVNNGMLGTIRMHQEREYPGRLAATQLVNPDFVALAQALGAYAERVTHEADFPAAFARAQQSGRPALLELPTDPAQLTPTLRLAAPSAP